MTEINKLKFGWLFIKPIELLCQWQQARTMLDVIDNIWLGSRTGCPKKNQIQTPFNSQLVISPDSNVCWPNVAQRWDDSTTGDPLHSRAACTQPCNVNTHSRAHCSPRARLCEQWGHGCVNNGARLCAGARLCRGSPVSTGPKFPSVGPTYIVDWLVLRISRWQLLYASVALHQNQQPLILETGMPDQATLGEHVFVEWGLSLFKPPKLWVQDWG